ARHGRWRVLAFPSTCDPGGAPRRDIVAVDVCLAVLANRREEYGALVGDERGLVVVAGAMGDVPGRCDRDPGWRTVGNVQAGEIHVGAGDALRSSALEQQAAEQHGRRGRDDVRAQVGTTEMPLLGQHGVSSAVSGWSA